MFSNRCSTNHIQFPHDNNSRAVSESLLVLLCNGLGHGHAIRAAAEAWPHSEWKTPRSQCYLGQFGLF